MNICPMPQLSPCVYLLSNDMDGLPRERGESDSPHFEIA